MEGGARLRLAIGGWVGLRSITEEIVALLNILCLDVRNVGGGVLLIRVVLKGLLEALLGRGRGEELAKVPAVVVLALLRLAPVVVRPVFCGRRHYLLWGKGRWTRTRT